MDEYAQLRALLDLAESLGVAIRRQPPSASEGPSAHPGGALVKLKGQEMLFLDPAAPVAERIAVTAAGLRGRKQLEQIYIPPKLRQLIEGQ